MSHHLAGMAVPFGDMNHYPRDLISRLIKGEARLEGHPRKTWWSRQRTEEWANKYSDRAMLVTRCPEMKFANTRVYGSDFAKYAVWDPQAGVGLRVINPLCGTTKKALRRYLRAVNQMCRTPNLARTFFRNLSDNKIVDVSYTLNRFINTIRNHMRTWGGCFFNKDPAIITKKSKDFIYL